MRLYVDWNGKKIISDTAITDLGSNIEVLVKRKNGSFEQKRILTHNISGTEMILPLQIFVNDEVYILNLLKQLPTLIVENQSVATTYGSYDPVYWSDFDIMLAFGKGSGKNFPDEYPTGILKGIPKVRHGTWISESATGQWSNLVKRVLNTGTINIAKANGDPKEYFATHMQILKDRCGSVGKQGVIDIGRGWKDVASKMPLMIDVESLVPWWTPNPLDPESCVDLYDDWYSEKTKSHYNYWALKLYNLTWETLVRELGHNEVYFYHSTRSTHQLPYDFWQSQILGRNPFWIKRQPFLTGVIYIKPGTSITKACSAWSKMHVSLAEAKKLGKKFYAIIGVGYLGDNGYEPKYTSEELSMWFTELRLRGVDGCILWASTNSSDADMYRWVQTELKEAVS